MNHLLFYVKENQISLILPLISLQFSKLKKVIFLFSGTERHTKLKLSPHMDSRLIYTWIGLLVFTYSFISSIFFLSNSKTLNFLSHFSVRPTKVETWYTHGQRVDLLCTPNTSSQNILVSLFFFFFLSLQLAKIKNLHLQNCFNFSDGYDPGYVSFAHSLLYFHKKFISLQRFS